MKVSILVVMLLSCAFAKQLYDVKKSYVTPVNEINFEKQINKIRQTTKYVTIVHFYKYSDGESRSFAPKYDEFTNEYKGIFRIASCDCDEAEKICQKESVSKFPTFRVYPPYPVPAIDFEGPLEIDGILKLATKYIHNNVIEITEANINTFINENPTVPKVLLFSEKKGFPLVYKGLSVEFEKKLSFGIVRASEKALLDRYSIKSFPKLLLVKTNEKKPFPYTGEYKFKPMFDFLNVHSEVFVPGGGSSADSAATKEWMMQVVPQLHQRSANDICLKVESAICVILLNNGDKPDNGLVDELKKLNQQYERHINRGTVFKFMWLDAKTESKWGQTLEFQGEPKIVLLNPSKRKRFAVHEGEMTFEALQRTLEKLISGDLKFKNLGESLPDFVKIDL
ncbi:unnamed protein product [Paramecium octaurelia]|uniref:Thioredoxin domain-containing protein n=1 Tax=Paramecium octaurelia TaxID=43137 RepID=A0A8S1XYY1_PAROT|nr:unnamed protein product [Paramecium octaurelia]